MTRAAGTASVRARPGAVRTLVVAGLAGLGLGSVIIAVLHVIGPGAAISPIRQTISEYGLTSAAWAFDVAVLAVAAGSGAILTATALAASQGVPPGGSGRASRLGLLLGALWVAGLVTLVAFPKTNWAVGPSASGDVHRASSLVAFIALPLAVTMLLRGRLSGRTRGWVQARWTVGVALAALAWFAPIVVAIATTRRGGAWWTTVPLGLVERGMAVTEIAALVLLGVWSTRTVRRAVADRGAVPAGEIAPAAAAQSAMRATRRAVAEPAAPGPPVTDPVVP